MRKTRLLAAAVALFGLLGAGCQPARVYLKDRALDFWDCFGVGVTFGDGLLVNVRVTKVVQAGYGFYHVQKAGFFGRQLGLWEEKRWEQGVSLFYTNSFQKVGLSGNSWFWKYMNKYPTTLYDDDADILQYWDSHWEDVGFRVHILKMGLDLTWRNIEFFDFISGIFGIDISWDDTWWEVYGKTDQQHPRIGQDEVY